MSYIDLKSGKKLLEIYRRHLAKLREQEAKFDGVYLPFHIESSIKDVLDSIQGLKSGLQEAIRNKERRLQQLQIQAARYGISTPPEVNMEIEDLTKEIKEMNEFLTSEFVEPDVPPATQYI